MQIGKYKVTGDENNIVVKRENSRFSMNIDVGCTKFHMEMIE